MSRRRPTYIPRPRNLNAYQVACRLGVGEQWFRDNYKNLRAAGFPDRDQLLDGWDSDAIDIWWDRRSGLAEHPECADDGLQRRLEAMSNGDMATGG